MSEAQAQSLGSEAEMAMGNGQYLTFLLGKEEYGVEILRVHGIQGWEPATEIPNTPPFVLGVINLRGAVVPIVDLRKRFGLPDFDFGPTTVVIVVKVMDEDRERTVGIVVDAVSDVHTVTEKERQPPPDLGSTIGTDFISGLVTVGDKMLILLDIDRLINGGLLGSLGDNEVSAYAGSENEEETS